MVVHTRIDHKQNQTGAFVAGIALQIPKKMSLILCLAENAIGRSISENCFPSSRVLSFLHGSQGSFEEVSESNNDYTTEARIRANRISVMRVINQSGGHSKQFLGFQGTQQHRSRVAYFEVVEDALIDSANLFSPTELPEHRVAWLRMLADFQGI